MPHVVFDSKLDLEVIWENMEKVLLKEPHIIRFNDIFLNNNKNSILIDTTVIDSCHQNFFIQILGNNEKTTIRLYPLTDPEKTMGVKRSLAIVAANLSKIFPNIKVSKTNISEFLIS